MHKAERCRRECDAMRECEGADCFQQLPATARDDEQREHEQQMVNAC